MRDLQIQNTKILLRITEQFTVNFYARFLQLKKLAVLAQFRRVHSISSFIFLPLLVGENSIKTASDVRSRSCHISAHRNKKVTINHSGTYYPNGFPGTALSSMLISCRQRCIIKKLILLQRHCEVGLHASLSFTKYSTCRQMLQITTVDLSDIQTRVYAM